MSETASPAFPSAAHDSIDLTHEQRALVERPISGDTLFLEGPAGVGKTTVATARLRHLLNERVPAEHILVMAPHRTLLTPYMQTLRSPDLPPGGTVNTLTIGSLARRMVDLFWPLVAEGAGFAQPDHPPVFLTLETAQYHMARAADPVIEAGGFDEVAIEHNRLLSQILDNLNKAALVRLDHTQVGERLRLAWTGASARAAIYDRAQECANNFRARCLAHNLLDFSLQIEVFVKQLLTLRWPTGEGFLSRFTRFRHLIVDNVEEDTPVTHDLLRALLPSCDSALVIYDRDAGYRIFLGADPVGARELEKLCRHTFELHTSLVTTPHLRRMGYELARGLRQTPLPLDDESGDLNKALATTGTPLRFQPQMLDWVAGEIAQLVHGRNVPPGRIVVVAPYLSDALRFSLSQRLTERGVPARSHRPSRALRDEPAARCLLTIATLAHPEWGHIPLHTDIAHALTLAIEPLDPVRAQLLTSIIYRPKKTRDAATIDVADAMPSFLPTLTPFAGLKTGVQERIGYQSGNRFDALRDWLIRDAQSRENRENPPLDHFFGRLFGEVLSQPGYGFHRDFDAGRIAAQLIESARKFRQAMERVKDDSAPPIGQEYMRMVGRGVIAAQFVPAWGSSNDEESAVLLAPAYTFLMRNHPVDFQFWLNVGSTGWWERLFQPLTHPYVLSRRWRHGDAWTDSHEVEAQTQAMHRLVQGLIRRCRIRIYLGISELGEQGYEQRGRLLQVIQDALRRSRTPTV